MIASCAIATSCSQDRALVIRGGTIITGTGASPIANGRLVVEGDRLRCVGANTECPSPAGASDIDATGFWIVPGLVDAHIHPRFTNRDRAERRQRLRFLLGVTLTRDGSTGGSFEANVLEARRATGSGEPSPRLLVSARVTPGEFADRERAAETARRLVETGVPWLKVHELPPDSVIVFAAEAARDAGLPIYGHAWADEPSVRSLIRLSLDAGFVGFSHMLAIPPLAVPAEVLRAPPGEPGSDTRRVWRRSLWLEADPAVLDSVARSLAERGAWLEPLLASEQLWAEPYRFPAGLYPVAELPMVADAARQGPDIQFTDAHRERMGRSVERMRRFLKTFHDAGGVLITGSDEALAPGLVIHEEMRLLVETGLTPAEALAAATTNAATALGVSDSLGTIEVGKLADLVVLEGNPLEEITNTQLISRVVKGGVLYDPASLLDSLHDDLTDRTTDGTRRMLIGLFATLFVLGAAGLGVRRHRSSLRGKS